MDPIKGDGLMTTRKRAGGAVFAVAAAALTIVLGATTALAATTLTVKVTSGGTYTASSGKTVLTDNGASVTCTSSKASGTIATHTYRAASPVQVGTSKTLSFSNCTGPLGAVTVHVLKLPYAVNVDSKTNTKGQTDGFVSGVSAHVSMTACSFNVTGSAPGFYTNSTHTLTLTPTLPISPLNSERLTVSGVSGCAGLVRNGDHPTYKGSYKVSRAIVIKSS
jgi:hypothetical protein